MTTLQRVFWYTVGSFTIWFTLICFSFITAEYIDAIEKWPCAIGNVTTLWCFITSLVSVAFPVVSIWVGVYWLLYLKDKK